jgi:hypothetical protein
MLRKHTIVTLRTTSRQKGSASENKVYPDFSAGRRRVPLYSGKLALSCHVPGASAKNRPEITVVDVVSNP